MGVAEGWTSDAAPTWTAAAVKDLRDVTTVSGRFVAMDGSGAIHAEANGDLRESLLPPPDTNVWTRFASSIP